jgi:hypothetical protein
VVWWGSIFDWSSLRGLAMLTGQFLHRLTGQLTGQVYMEPNNVVDEGIQEHGYRRIQNNRSKPRRSGCID